MTVIHSTCQRCSLRKINKPEASVRNDKSYVILSRVLSYSGLNFQQTLIEIASYPLKTSEPISGRCEYISDINIGQGVGLNI